MRGNDGLEEVDYGEYPQMAAPVSVSNELDMYYNSSILAKTGKIYTFDSRKYDDYNNGFDPVYYEEYLLNGKKYIRVKANSDFEGGEFKLSNGEEYVDNDYVWVEVSPVRWLVDRKKGILLSKKSLLSGIRFNPKRDYKGDFENTEMKSYMENYMFHDLFEKSLDIEVDKIPSVNIEEETKKRNPYNFTFGNVSEEEIIKGAIESGVAVFLHGQSSEGKSARIKQIDPECEILYLGSATPELINGKSVFNSNTGEMIDIPPTWLKKLESRCEKEPDKLHIVFMDELTNARPAIQSMAFNIVLDREVNGLWKLPENARIVAAGNEMKDSLAANQMAEPLFNRFAHVYIKTTVESWLKWANDNNIHPAIYAFIAYKKESALRSDYNGETPNADPRKWEMASKLLYKTGRPDMLRALVGEEITREFCQFCNQKVVSLEDVLNNNYTERDLMMNTSEKYATTVGLSRVDEDDFIKVREFVTKLGTEFSAIFDSLWVQGDEKRLERIAELRMSIQEGGMTL